MERIVVAGEALVDFISKDPGKDLAGSKTFEKRPGGAPLNVAVGLTRLGVKTTFLTKLSKDSFGRFLVKFMESEGLDTSFLVFSEELKTTLAFVAVDERGKPDFEFYRKGSADLDLRREEVSIDLKKIKLFHFGSISLIEGYSSETFLWMFENLSGKATTSFDPNIRRSLVKNRDGYLEKIEKTLRGSDILKVSLEDMLYISGDEDVVTFSKRFRREDKITILTMGENGSVVYSNGRIHRQKALSFGEVVDTTGCGDAFVAGFLKVILERGMAWNSIVEAMEFASVVSGIVASRYGAASSIPTIDEVKKRWEGWR